MTVRISKFFLLVLLLASAAFAFPQATRADAGCPNGSTGMDYTCSGCDAGYSLEPTGEYQYACADNYGNFFYCGTGGYITPSPQIQVSPLYSCVANTPPPPPEPECETYEDTRACSDLAGGAWVPAGYTEGDISFSQEACTLDGVTTWYDPVQTGGSCTQPATSPVQGCTDPSADNYSPLAGADDGSCTYPPVCTEDVQTPVSCAAYAGSLAPSGYTEGSASYTKNSCTGAETYTGGCSAPAQSCSAPTSCGTYPSCSVPDCAGTCGGSATDYNGGTAGCGSAPSCANGAINPTTCDQCSSTQVMSSGSCVNCSNGGCTNGSCDNGASNPPSCNSFPTPAPTVSITLAASATQGSTIPLSYSSTDATSCSSPALPEVSATSGTIANISSILSPGNNTIGITCIGDGGSTTAYDSINLLVPSVDIMASPMRVRSGNPSTISWSTVDVSSCSITGPNLSSSELSGNQPVSITIQSLFTITCDGLSDSVTVNIIPLFQEF